MQWEEVDQNLYSSIGILYNSRLMFLSLSILVLCEDLFWFQIIFDHFAFSEFQTFCEDLFWFHSAAAVSGAWSDSGESQINDDEGLFSGILLFTEKMWFLLLSLGQRLMLFKFVSIKTEHKILWVVPNWSFHWWLIKKLCPTYLTFAQRVASQQSYLESHPGPNE